MTTLFLDETLETPKPASLGLGGPYTDDESVERLARAFETRTLPKADWTHHAHLTVALRHLMRYPLEEATKRIRTGIPRYNEAVGTINSDTSGYHDTITLFWIWAVGKYLENAEPGLTLAELANGLPAFGRRDLPLEYYSREVLFSVEARKTYVPPDLKPME